MLRLIQVVGHALRILCIALWFSWVALVASWIGHRPSVPDPLHPYGIQPSIQIFLTETDVRAARSLVLLSAISFGLAFGAYVLEARVAEGRRVRDPMGDADRYGRRMSELRRRRADRDDERDAA